MAASSSRTAASPHPMVPVPDAIRTVLEVTARAILSRTADETTSRYDEVACNAPFSQLLGRLLADDVRMSRPGYPPYRASVMDGYAIRCDHYQHDARTHRVSGRVHAGPSSHGTNAHEAPTDDFPTAVYVTTGARIPDTYDCVVPIEEIQESSDRTIITISGSAIVQPGQWIRNVGCDIPAGAVIIPRGSCIHPISLGLLQQSGQATIKLIKPTKVGVLSTGNELLVSPDSWAQHVQAEDGNGGLLQTGQIPDVNKPILQALITSFGNCQAIDLGMERDDDIESMTTTIEKASETCDVILTTGGISMGETDIVEEVLVRRLRGTLHFGRLNMKPGKPTTFVTIQRSNSSSQCLVFALPGNPVSATVCTHLLVRPALNMLQQYGAIDISGDGQEQQEMVRNTLVHPEVTATLAHDIKLDMERPEYHRVLLDVKSSHSGMEYTATSTGVQASSRLMSLRDAEGLLVLPRGTAEKPKALAGQQYTVLLLAANYPPILLKNSTHLIPKIPLPTLRVAITQVVQDVGKYQTIAKAELTTRVQKALSRGQSGSVEVVSCDDISGPLQDLGGHFSHPNRYNVDIWVVSCSGSFMYCLQVSNFLRALIGKIADAVALQARKGAASQDETAALFETLVGYTRAENPEDGCILIALPANGLDVALESVQHLLKHAIKVARGKPLNNHHEH